MKIRNLLFIAFVMAFMTSCATIFTGTKSKVNITSIPSGARILVDGIDRGVTPSVVKLKRGFDSQSVTLKLDGYSDKIFEPEQTFQIVSVLNFTNLLGWGIDAITGSIKKYNPKFYEIKLDPTAVKN